MESYHDTTTILYVPDLCTSLICAPPHWYCPQCSHAIWYGEGFDVNGKLWRWDFNPRFGPHFLRKDGEPLVHQPLYETHPAWLPFYLWLRQYPEREKDL